jgi:hypothetical protein
MSGDLQNPVDSVAQEPVAQPSSEDKVAYGTFKKLLDEKKAMQSQFNEMKAEFDRIKAERESAEQQKMIEQNRFKELYEVEQSKAKKAMELLEGHKRDMQENEKKKAVLSKLGLKREEFAKFVEMDRVTMVDDRVDEASLDAYVSEFKTKFPELVVEQKTPPPTSPAPSVNGKVISYDPKNPASVMEAFKRSQK